MHSHHLQRNRGEALVVFPVDTPDAAARAAAVVKLGAQGAFFLSADESGFQPAFPVTAVDTVAVGDAFNGALAALPAPKIRC